MKQIAIISFTKKGAELNSKLLQGFKISDTLLTGYGIEKYNEDNALTPCGIRLHSYQSVHELMKTLMTQDCWQEEKQPFAEDRLQGKRSLDGIIFVGACGIAVRAIAPYIRDKAKDPAVVVVDEGANHVISLLSGHLGGANELTKKIAAFLLAVPVITTATDTRKVFAVDSFAVKNSLYITDTTKIKEISSALLHDQIIGFYSEYPIKGRIPNGLTEISHNIFDVKQEISDIKQNETSCEQNKLHKGICIAKEDSKLPFPQTIHLLPRNLVVGIGCKKNVAFEAIYQRLQKVFLEYGLKMERISKLCSIDIKSKEPGLVKLADSLGIPLCTFTAKELKEVTGDFTSSIFVENTVGVDNVCERSGALGSQYGKQIVGKYSGEGITLSVYEAECVINF